MLKENKRWLVVEHNAPATASCAGCSCRIRERSSLFPCKAAHLQPQGAPAGGVPQEWARTQPCTQPSLPSTSAVTCEYESAPLPSPTFAPAPPSLRPRHVLQVHARDLRLAGGGAVHRERPVGAEGALRTLRGVP